MDFFYNHVFSWLPLIILMVIWYFAFFSRHKTSYVVLVDEQNRILRDSVEEARRLNALLTRIIDEQSVRVTALEAKYEVMARSGPAS